MKYVAASLAVLLVAGISFAAGVWYGEGEPVYVVQEDDGLALSQEEDDSVLSWNGDWLTIRTDIPKGVVFKTSSTVGDSVYKRMTGFKLTWNSSGGEDRALLCDGLDCTEVQ